MRRVVVTGMGAITPMGLNVKEYFDNIKAGNHGFTTISKFDASEYKAHVAAEVKGFVAKEYMDFKAAKRMEPFSQYAVAAAKEAMEQAGLDMSKEDPYRVGCSIGSGIGGLGMICDNYLALHERGARRVSPFMIPGTIINMISGQLSIMFGLKGPNIAHVTACTTGLHGIGEASWIIRRGDADVMVAGGADASICPVGVAGFDNMHALSRRNDDPAHASRPFDKDRDGFVMGEGAGVVVIEELEHALARGAHIYAEIVGYGLTSDAGHITTPNTDGPRRCMEMALARAGIKPEDIDYLNAHGTSTSVGDINETKAIKEAFGEAAKKLVVNSTKSMTGHLLGGAGGIESVFTILAVKNQVSPPTINIVEQDAECDLDYCANAARPMKIRYAMKNSFGFGGTNGTLIFKHWEE